MSQFSSVQLLSHVQLFATPQTAVMLGFSVITNSQSLLKFRSISPSVDPFSSCIHSFPESGSFPMSQFFVSGGQSMSFSFNISPSNEYLGLISFRIDWLDLLAVQGTSLLQYHSSNPSILQCSAFFIVQLSHPYMTTGKTIALTNGPLLAK